MRRDRSGALPKVDLTMKSRFTSRRWARLRCMTDTNLAPWGLWVVPLGLAICFGPALLVWLRAEIKARKDKR